MRTLTEQAKAEIAQNTLVWFHAKLQRGRPWTFALSTHAFLNSIAPEDDDEAACGITIDMLRLVLIDASTPRREQDETCFHEMMHACLMAPKRLDVTQEFMSRGVICHGKDKGVEEEAVQVFSPRLYPALTRIGFSWPPRPIGAAAFERRARKEVAT